MLIDDDDCTNKNKNLKLKILFNEEILTLFRCQPWHYADIKKKKLSKRKEMIMNFDLLTNGFVYQFNYQKDSTNRQKLKNLEEMFDLHQYDGKKMNELTGNIVEDDSELIELNLDLTLYIDLDL